MSLHYPTVHSKKEYMDFMGSLMSQAEEEEHQPGGRRQLKSYIIESNSNVPQEFDTGQLKGIIKPTEIEGIKTFTVQYRNHLVPFFLDVTDHRFWVLHTNALSNIAKECTRKLIRTDKYEFDNAWFASNMLTDISQLPGNAKEGFKINYQDLFLDDELDVPVEELKININGRSSDKALLAIQSEQDLKNVLAFSGIRIRRGSRPTFAEDDMSFHGAFVVKKGTSVDDHISLVETAKTRYREKMKEVEDFSIGVKTIDNRTLVEGKAFDLEFRRSIENMDIFMDRLVSPMFRLWGLKHKINNDLYQFLAVDLHTGDPFDLEISKDSMRVYLPKGSCGNVVLRLLVNLQHFYDSNIKCDELNLHGANA